MAIPVYFDGRKVGDAEIKTDPEGVHNIVSIRVRDAQTEKFIQGRIGSITEFSIGYDRGETEFSMRIKSDPI